ncbi:MAG TPA: Fur family transcriptional regulator [Caulobacteraceae bacterium]|nr:Fur family transcriptional regulator [Caulobacteraceae bacterium]
MPRVAPAAHQEALRRAGLPVRGRLADLFALLRASPDTHLRLAEVAHMAAEAGLAATPVEIDRQLKTLADHGLLSRLPSTAPEPVFDTVPEPHFHLVYEDPAQIVDLDVSPETLFAILRNALAERPDSVEIMVRFRAIRSRPRTQPSGNGASS